MIQNVYGLSLDRDNVFEFSLNASGFMTFKNENFENAASELVKKSTQLYWNFAEVPGDLKDTYYIRIKPCFVYNNNEYVYGQWSNVVVAEYEEPVIEPEAVEKIDFFPWIPKKINLEKLLNIDWSKYVFKFK